MAGRLAGKVAIVTGAGSGQGAAAAALFVEEGARVALLDVREQGLNEVAATLDPDRVLPVVCDVSDAAAVRAAVDRVVGAFGRLDVLYNNAGVLLQAPPGTGQAGFDGGVVDLDEDVFDRTLAINVKSVYLMAKFSIPPMRERGGGSIVNVASMAGAIVGSANHAYATSKAAIVGLTRAIAVTYGSVGIRANAICPGVVRTPIVEHIVNDEATRRIFEGSPLGRLGRPDEIARVALFLACDESSFVTGAQVTADGGFTLR
jgi:NAD(P)-dependent dehydrogenase (short-subunit alcohol dehydrogenase family)